MKFNEFLLKVKESDDYKKFDNEKPDAYICAGFFVLDYKDGKNQSSIDFYSPKENQMVSFKLDEKVTAVPLEAIKENYVPEKIGDNPGLDIEELKGIITDEMHNRGMTYEVQKLIIILQNLEGKLIWNCTALLSGMALLKTHIEDESASVILMEKSSFFDFIKPLKTKPGQSMKEALEEMQNTKYEDHEKSEGNQEGFIG